MHQSVEVIYKRVDQCPLVNSQLSFFQMVYVISGSGFLHINGNAISYQTGNLMLLTPNDYYRFDIITTTDFLLVKLSSEYAKEYKSKSIDHIECLFHYASHLSGCILNRKADEYLVKSIVESLVYTMDNTDIYDEDLVIHYVNALVVIAARNIAKIKPLGIKESADKRILEIINYIQENIFFPQKIKVSVIAGKFDISDTYLGSYFKNHCGETIQSFVSNYKIRLIEHRLSFSDMRINEIVDEFGFSDESHLNKFLKKHRNISLTGYRKAKALLN